MIGSLRHWIAAKYDYISGSIAGSITGIKTFATIEISILSPLIITVLVSIITGAAGAFGAHLFKLLIKSLNKHKNG